MKSKKDVECGGHEWRFDRSQNKCIRIVILRLVDYSSTSDSPNEIVALQAGKNGIRRLEFLELFSAALAKLFWRNWVLLFNKRLPCCGELEKLNGTVKAIQALLLDAEEQQEHSHRVKDWLEKLTALLFDAEDLLDDVASEALRKEAAARDQDDDDFNCRVQCWTAVCFLFTSLPNRLIYGLKLVHKVKCLREQLDVIYADNTKLHLTPRLEEMGKMRMHTQTISSIPDIVVGREDDRDEIKILLLANNDVCVNLVNVVSIVGIGGMGKTTLAQLLYNDREIKEAFDLRLWVCVSDAFEVGVIVLKILESATKQKQQDLELDTLIYLLDGVISGKKYVLVLDDVWNFDNEKWDVLRSVLNRGSKGSKILITTRFENYAKKMSHGCHRPYTLRSLSSPQSWSLFSQIVFGVGDHQLDDGKQQNILNVEEMKTEIMKKTAGVPIAVKTIANILYSIESQTEWLPFLGSHKLLGAEHEGSILHNLKLSYDYLPSHLKRCFLLCSLYPKGREIHVESLINEWSALGFIKSAPNDSQQSVVESGLKCLMELAWRSFFQEIKRDADDTLASCKMHDLIHDLAVSLAGSGYKQIVSPTDRISEKTHHISLSHNLWSPSELVGHMDRATRLRSFANLEMEWYQTGTNWDDSTFKSFVLKFGSLRHLGFGNSGMAMVPHHIQELKHLRYLCLSMNEKLTRLPNSITRLQHLQMLGLYGCTSLQELPRDIKKLINLWYLSCTNCPALSYMPSGLGELTRLEVLTRFVVGKDSSASKHIGGLDELNKLNNLRGQFRIVNLRYLREEMRWSPPTPSLAFEIGAAARLKGKLHLEALILCWDDDSDNSERSECEECLKGSAEDAEWDEQLLESLEPHSNLKALIVTGYKGGRSSSWISSLTNLVTLQLACCKVRQGLHHLQVLPTLRSVSLVKLIELDYMDEDEDDDLWVMKEAALKNASKPFFSSLQDLHLGQCPKLKGWKRKPPQFPKLSKLFIFECPLLTSMPLFPTLDKKLTLIDTSIQPLLCTMTYMSSSSPCLLPYLSSSSELEVQYPLSKLKKLHIENIHHPPREWLQGMQHLTSLQEIKIEDCSGLEKTSNWKNIAHVPNVVIDEYNINREGGYCLDQRGWSNFSQILKVLLEKKEESRRSAQSSS